MDIWIVYDSLTLFIRMFYSKNGMFRREAKVSLIRTMQFMSSTTSGDV